MFMIAFVCAALLALGLAVIVFGRARRRPARLPTEIHSMRQTLERKVREGADFRI